MSDEFKPKPFRFAPPPQTSFTMRDIDNAQPQPPKPRGLTVDHTRLAPPGMSGVKTSTSNHRVQANDSTRVNVNVIVNVSGDDQRYRPSPNRTPPAAKEQTRVGNQQRVTKVFKPLVPPRRKFDRDI